MSSDYYEHNIEWTNEKISRLWNYYSQNSPYNEEYFSKKVGKDIILKTEKIIGSINDKIVLDFGCGPGFLIDHLIEMKKHRSYILD